jgi:2-polyprenyl-3-methyl-5-hydroxy-6-metoxy-1,4-benzoquinol methylase
MNQNSESFDRLAEGYDFMVSLESGRYDFFLNNLPPGRSRALDIGCGTGGLALELSKHFQSVLAIDISEPMLEIARRKRAAPNIDYRNIDANALELFPEFNLIASHTAFHHLNDVSATLEKLKSALKPRGRLIVVDCVCETLKIPWFIIVAGPFFDFIRDSRRRGVQTAARLFRFRLSRPWREHLASDTFFSERGFCEVYGKALPIAKFTRMGNFMGVIWGSHNDST